ncbi:hypothetical protein K1T71_003986 [Dendrolimus kikuchii]|uniref:Uncharacterized protein n=1 Tax=Dendrolimus kikuchii TaxID=765133 RepID=A0ACC1DAH8_9NEOP|nr:hypothetical protein K1T71_003986 [Dendrolimus kikuchii]
MEMILEVLNNLSTKANLEKWDRWELSKVQRLGRKEGKAKPILVTVTLTWTKIEVLKNNKLFSEGIYVTEDYLREVLSKGKELKAKLNEEREKGKIAFIRYGKLILKEAHNEKTRRSPTKSPPQQQKLLENVNQPNKKNIMDAFTLMRPRSASLKARHSESQ